VGTEEGDAALRELSRQVAKKRKGALLEEDEEEEDEA
jgi:hypothetical protein